MTELMHRQDGAREHHVLIIAKNHDGIGARILNLFHRRGFNVVKMTSGVAKQPEYARLTLTVKARPELLDQIQKQIYKIIDVVKVKIYQPHTSIARELMLIKVKASAETRTEIAQIAQIYRGHILDVAPHSMVIELTGDEEKLKGFATIMHSFGILEMATTGVTAMSRGEKM